MDVWNSFPEATTAFLTLGSMPPEVNDTSMAILERFVVLLYDRTSTKTSVNDPRKQLFVKKGRQFDNITPTRAALLEHSKRAVFQADTSGLKLLLQALHCQVHKTRAGP